MNKKDLEKLGLTVDALKKAELPEDLGDQIVIAHGKDIEAHKKKVEVAEGQVATLTTQLEEANTQISEFKSMDVEKIKATASDWEAKAKAADKQREAEVAQLKLQHAIERELKEVHGVIDPEDLVHRLKMDMIKLNGDDKLIGLAEQVEPLKESKAYLFSSDDSSDADSDADGEKKPRLVTGAKKKKVDEKPSLETVIGQRMGLTKS